MTHAYFKALLFLAAGAVIHSYHHEHDIFRMGGLRRRLPVAFWSFMLGSAALVALPFTSGYYSKHEILLAAYAAGGGGWLWGAGVCGALLTGLYSARLVFVAFFGRENRQAREHLGPSMRVPLLVLCGLSLLGGHFVMPFDSVFGEAGEVAPPPIATSVVTTAAPVVGVAIAAAFYWRQSWLAEALLAFGTVRMLRRFWFSGWGLDWLYEHVFVLPFKALAALNQADVIDGLYRGVATLCRRGNRQVAVAQNGQLRWYVASLVGGAALIVALGVWR